jgi:hypothetical protein
MNKQISTWPLSASAYFIQNRKALLVNQESIKTASKIDQFSDADRVAALTSHYLELGLPLVAALRAAEADLWSSRLFRAVLAPANAPAVGRSAIYKNCTLTAQLTFNDDLLPFSVNFAALPTGDSFDRLHRFIHPLHRPYPTRLGLQNY